MTTKTLRRHALGIFRASLAAADPAGAVARHLERRNFARFRHIYVIGAGKAGASMAQAAERVLGARITVPTPTGAVTMTVPKGSNTGTVLRLRGKGVLRRDGNHGDELVRLKVMLPERSDPELEAFATKWEGGKAYDPRRDMKP